jgi:predicted lysophospholipase L1 biosynthesis ABC-type transport system permease subunit
VRAHVVGIVVINDPITSQSGAGEGAYLTQPLMLKIVGHGLVPQSIVIKVDPHLDRATAIESVRRDFSGSIREATPQVDLRNLGHMRSVPWLISALVALLALATLIHALVLMLTRNRKNLAVLAALGFTRGQRRGVGIFASTALVFVGTLIAVPVGLIVGTRIWRGVTQHVGLPTQSAVPWSTLVVAPISALAIAALVSLFTSRGAARMTPSEQLRVE